MLQIKYVHIIQRESPDGKPMVKLFEIYSPAPYFLVSFGLFMRSFQTQAAERIAVR